MRISTTINLHPSAAPDYRAHILNGIDFHKEAGFDALDINLAIVTRIGDGWQPIIEEAAEYVKTKGLRFELCHLPFGFKTGTQEEEDLFLSRVYRSIDAAKILGVDYAVAHPNTTTIESEKYDPKADYELVMHHMAPIVEYGNKQGVNVVVENMRTAESFVPVNRYCGTPEEVCTVADALGIGICWDFGHAHICGLKQSDALKYVGDRLRMVHVNDNFAWGDDHIAPFTGKIDWQDAAQGLAAIGYKGLFNFEVACRLPAAARMHFARTLIESAKAIIAMMD